MDSAIAGYRNHGVTAMNGSENRRTTFHCSDGVTLAGHVWSQPSASAIVIVNPATGVLARYYHRYAKFLAEHGFEVITYDYRGIGESRPEDLRRCGFRWSEWGTKDFAKRHVLGTKMFIDSLSSLSAVLGGFIGGGASLVAAACIPALSAAVVRLCEPY